MDNEDITGYTLDNFGRYGHGYLAWIYTRYMDMKEYIRILDWISFLGFDLYSYPNSQKTSLHILAYPFIS